MLDAVHESDRFGLQCCRHEPRRRAALGCNRRRGSRTPPEVQECENRGWTVWTATCRIKQAGRISGSPLEWKPVGRSDEGTPVRRQNKAQLLVPGSGHAESTGDHTVPMSGIIPLNGIVDFGVNLGCAFRTVGGMETHRAI